MIEDVRPILVRRRICLFCGRRIPHFRAKRVMTCSVQHSNAYNRIGVSLRIGLAWEILNKLNNMEVKIHG
ncbi:MAG TPA: hypothetical protein ENI02_02980 [Candidatus Aminicenantes bacterium]|nr:hypothetical protein [Candidatus Aminicenantes bacterium]